MVRPTITFLLLIPGLAVAQAPDSASAQIRAVLRAYYSNYEAGNWDALASYVLSPKLMERRGAPADSALVLKDRTRSRTVAHAVSAPAQCPSSASPMVNDAAIRVDGDWADISVARCVGAIGGVDEFRMMYFEKRWRFIYTDMADGAEAQGEGS